ncbi:hypothetical protein C5S29_11525 [ANME-1 cluster archaeon GoMg3.2]|nr:hypothetical protein [ANME-1 cluster archaeon GoMg3.2]
MDQIKAKIIPLYGNEVNQIIGAHSCLRYTNTISELYYDLCPHNKGAYSIDCK